MIKFSESFQYVKMAILDIGLLINTKIPLYSSKYVKLGVLDRSNNSF